MGLSLVRVIRERTDLTLTGAIDRETHAGKDVGVAFDMVTTVSAVCFMFVWSIILASYLVFRKRRPQLSVSATKSRLQRWFGPSGSAMGARVPVARLRPRRLQCSRYNARLVAL